jgi:hypothetical protein
MRLFNLRLVSGFLKLPDKPTPPPDERDGPSSGLSRTSSGQQPEPDDNKPLTYAGYSGYRRVRQVIREGMREDIRGDWEEENRQMVLWRCSRHDVRSGQGGLRILQM